VPVSRIDTWANSWEAAVDRDEHFKLLRASGAKVDELQEELQGIRDQEAALQAQRVEKLDALKTARQERFKFITAAIADRIPKAQIARELRIDRTTLYKMMKDDSTEA
jgi:transcriptional regulator of acetoin/glycerol metabolism